MVFVADVEDGFELRAENDMDESIIASPVAVADRLFLRGIDNLFCIAGD